VKICEANARSEASVSAISTKKKKSPRRLFLFSLFTKATFYLKNKGSVKRNGIYCVHGARRAVGSALTVYGETDIIHIDIRYF